MSADPPSPEKRICRNPYDEDDNRVPGTLVDAPRILDRGFFGRGGDLVVEESTVVVLTEDGRHVATLEPGKHLLKAFKHGSQLKAFTVHTQQNTFLFKANNYFRITENTPKGLSYLLVNITLGIEFRVKPQNAFRLISSIKQPVGTLCNRLMSVVNLQLRKLDFDAFYGNGFFLAQDVLEQLQRNNIEGVTGLTIENVLPIACDGADTIAEGRANLVREAYDGLAELGLSPVQVKQIRIKSKELATMGQQDHEKLMLILSSVLEKGSVPPFLEKRVGSGGINDLIAFLLYGATPTNGIAQPPVIDAQPSPTPSATPPPDTTPVSAAVIELAWDALERLVGIGNVQGRPTTTGVRNVPDGGHEFVAAFRDAQGALVEVILQLPPGYASGAAPLRTVRRNGVVQNYPPVEAAEWRRNPKLTSLVEEAQRTYA